VGQRYGRLEDMGISFLEDIYKNKKVFVTGHTGFKGTWLLNLLHFLGADIKGYALAPTNDLDIYNQVKSDELCTSVIADIRDAEKLKKEILEFQPDFIFHLAAQPLVRLSYEFPLETFEVNSQGSANLLDALRMLDKACVCVMITTDKVYHNLETGHYYSEEDRLGGYDPYSASKASAEIVIDSYRNSFFHSQTYESHKKSVSVARAGNVIGGGDWSKDRIIPDIVKALSSQQPVKVRNPHSVRPWQHVLEPLVGYVLLGAHQYKKPTTFNTAFNFGPTKNDTIPVSKLVDMSIEKWGAGSYENQQLSNQHHEAGLLHLDISKAHNELQWQPKLSSVEAITQTIEWYKVALNQPATIKTFTRQQVINYLKL
jgi:CDP-glucose 4,6-dehydratase